MSNRITVALAIGIVEDRELLRILRADWKHFTVRHILRILGAECTPINITAMRLRLDKMVTQEQLYRSNPECPYDCADHTYWRRNWK